jgi:hypothetical protein
MRRESRRTDARSQTFEHLQPIVRRRMDGRHGVRALCRLRIRTEHQRRDDRQECGAKRA